MEPVALLYSHLENFSSPSTKHQAFTLKQFKVIPKASSTALVVTVPICEEMYFRAHCTL